MKLPENFFKGLVKDKNKKKMFYLVVLFLAGILFIFLSMASKNPKSEPGISLGAQSSGNTQIAGSSALSADDYEVTLTKKLTDILSFVDGAGKVQVMLTFSESREIVIAEDVKFEEARTSENDSEGGEREVYSLKTTGQSLFVKNKDGTETPVILKELVPKVEGVLTVAEGGGDVLIKDALMRAAQTVLGIELHKISVLKMK